MNKPQQALSLSGDDVRELNAAFAYQNLLRATINRIIFAIIIQCLIANGKKKIYSQFIKEKIRKSSTFISYLQG